MERGPSPSASASSTAAAAIARADRSGFGPRLGAAAAPHSIAIDRLGSPRPLNSVIPVASLYVVRYCIPSIPYSVISFERGPVIDENQQMTDYITVAGAREN